VRPSGKGEEEGDEERSREGKCECECESWGLGAGPRKRERCILVIYSGRRAFFSKTLDGYGFVHLLVKNRRVCSGGDQLSVRRGLLQQ
jgi:hypothetical protein